MRDVIVALVCVVGLVYLMVGLLEFGASDAYQYMQIMGRWHCHSGVCEVK